MRTTVVAGERTVIPAELRHRYNIGEGSKIDWIDTGVALMIIPVVRDPITALRGLGHGEKLLEKLLDERHREGERG